MLGTRQLNLHIHVPHWRGGQDIFEGGWRGGQSTFQGGWKGGRTFFQGAFLLTNDLLSQVREHMYAQKVRLNMLVDNVGRKWK